MSSRATALCIRAVRTFWHRLALNGGVRPGDVVAIVGAGPIGLSAITGARLFSPSLRARLCRYSRVPCRRFRSRHGSPQRWQSAGQGSKIVSRMSRIAWSSSSTAW